MRVPEEVLKAIASRFSSLLLRTLIYTKLTLNYTKSALFLHYFTLNYFQVTLSEHYITLKGPQLPSYMTKKAPIETNLINGKHRKV